MSTVVSSTGNRELETGGGGGGVLRFDDGVDFNRRDGTGGGERVWETETGRGGTRGDFGESTNVCSLKSGCPMKDSPR